MDSAIVHASGDGDGGVGVTIAAHSSLAPTCKVRRWMVSIVGSSPSGKKVSSKARARPVGQQGTELGQHALILWGAVIGQDLRHRREDRAQGHTALAGLKPRSAELNRAEQRPQLPWPPILQRPLSTTSRAASPDL